MLWSYALNLTYKRCVPVWLLQPVVFYIINWKFCFCFRHFNLNSPMSTGNWADCTAIFQACFHFLPLYLACPTVSFSDLLLFSFIFPQILFPDFFSFYNLILKQRKKPVSEPLVQSDSLYMHTVLSISNYCSEGNTQAAGRSRSCLAGMGRKGLELWYSCPTPAGDIWKMISCPSDFLCLSWGSCL